MAKPYKIGLIGCGLRGAWYLYNLKMANLDFSLKAMADPDVEYPDILNRLFADGSHRNHCRTHFLYRRYESEMQRQTRLDRDSSGYLGNCCYGHLVPKK